MEKLPIYKYLNRRNIFIAAGAVILLIVVIVLAILIPSIQRSNMEKKINEQVAALQVQGTLQSAINQTMTALAPTSTPTITPSPTPTLTPTPSPTPLPGSQRMMPASQMIQVYIPAGEFMMGSEETAAGATSREKPIHKVTLDAFWIDKTQVTNAMYALCVQAGACQYALASSHPAFFRYNDPAYANHPVVYVTWDNALAFCTWQGGTLPTEAQWEKAARGPDGAVYPWGSNPPNYQQANVDKRRIDTAAVDEFLEGRSYYGVLDMGSNVREWVMDWYSETYFQHTVDVNPTGPKTGDKRVLKGAAFDDPLKYSRAANRLGHDPTSAGLPRGFRCAAP